jgi:hypothetical protein
VILDPQPIGNGAGIGIDVGLEGGDAADQVLGGGMAVMVGEPELRVSYGIEAVIGFGGRGLI